MLLELTCALFIFSTGMLGVIHMYHVCINNTRALDEYMIAMRAIENEVETLRAMPFEELDNLNGEFTCKTPSLSKLVNVVTKTEIELFDNEYTNLRRLTATVKWTGDKGRTITKSVTTLIAEKQMASET